MSTATVTLDEVKILCLTAEHGGDQQKSQHYFPPPDKTFVQYVTKLTIFDYLYIRVCHMQKLGRILLSLLVHLLQSLT